MRKQLGAHTAFRTFLYVDIIVVRHRLNPVPATNPINLPARIALYGFVTLADVIDLVGFLPCAIRSRLVELQLPYLSFC